MGVVIIFTVFLPVVLLVVFVGILSHFVGGFKTFWKRSIAG